MNRQSNPTSVVERDATDQDWIQATGESHEQYSRGMRETIRIMQERTGHANRNEILREPFNQMARNADRSLNSEGVEAFYASDTYSRLLASEMPGTPNLLTSLIRTGIHQLSSTEPIAVAVQEVAGRTDGKFVLLDHGFGTGSVGLTVGALYPDSKVVMCDLWCPSRSVIEIAVKYNDALSNIHFAWAYPKRPSLFDLFLERGKGYDLIYSNEVLEHLVDPVYELRRFAACTLPGALLVLSTFFNSCNGFDPSHLDEHAQYQDVDKWFAIVKSTGWEPYANDPRGCLKVFKRDA